MLLLGLSLQLVGGRGLEETEVETGAGVDEATNVGRVRGLSKGQCTKCAMAFGMLGRRGSPRGRFWSHGLAKKETGGLSKRGCSAARWTLQVRGWADLGQNQVFMKKRDKLRSSKRPLRIKCGWKRGASRRQNGCDIAMGSRNNMQAGRLLSLLRHDHHPLLTPQPQHTPPLTHALVHPTRYTTQDSSSQPAR